MSNSDIDFSTTLSSLLSQIESVPTGSRREVVRRWQREQMALAKNGAGVLGPHEVLTLADIAEAMADETIKRKLVVIIHGIRDQGEWMTRVKSRLESHGLIVQPITFEYFDSLRFMTGFGVRAVIDRVLRAIRYAKSDNENTDLYIIAHSFGTYIAGDILFKQGDIKAKSVIFCGAVISRSYPFDRMPNRPHIVNECGARDIWPVVAQGFSFWNRYGAAGVFGINGFSVKDRFHDCGHSDYFSPEFVEKYWVPYLLHQRLEKSLYDDQRRNAPMIISLITYGWWALGISFIVLALPVGFGFWLDGLAAGRFTAIGATISVLLFAGTGWLVNQVIKGYVSPCKLAQPAT